MASEEILREIDLEGRREIFLKYARIAFEMLPKLNKPRILDVGCGSGIPTLELAKLSDGEIIGVDIDSVELEKLKNKIEEQGLSKRVKTIQSSLFNLDFPNESFDLIWAEGSLDLIGFRKGLKECSRLLKRNGFLVVGDQISRFKSMLKKLGKYDLELRDIYSMPEEIWWDEYYKPLEIKVNKLRLKYKNDPEAKGIFEKLQREIDMVKQDPKEYACAFYIIQKV